MAGEYPTPAERNREIAQDLIFLAGMGACCTGVVVALHQVLPEPESVAQGMALGVFEASVGISAGIAMYYAAFVVCKGAVNQVKKFRKARSQNNQDDEQAYYDSEFRAITSNFKLQDK